MHLTKSPIRHLTIMKYLLVSNCVFKRALIRFSRTKVIRLMNAMFCNFNCRLYWITVDVSGFSGDRHGNPIAERKL